MLLLKLFITKRFISVTLSVLNDKCLTNFSISLSFYHGLCVNTLKMYKYNVLHVSINALQSAAWLHRNVLILRKRPFKRQCHWGAYLSQHLDHVDLKK